MTLAGRAKKPYAARLPAAERREQLLDAALAIALARGFHAVTIDGVAKAAGVTRPVVYGVYSDRAALLQALADRSERRALAQLDAIFPAAPGPGDEVDPDELLLAGVTAYLSAVRDNPQDWTVILLPPEGAPGEMQARAHAHRRLLLGQLPTLSDWGLARRGGPAGVDPDLLARAVFTLAEGAARLLLVDPGRWQVEAFRDFTRAVLAGLRA